MEDPKPHFRFNPYAYAEGRDFVLTEEVCEVCGRPSVWKYTGCIYGAIDHQSVCARCISNGALEVHLGEDEYDLHDITLVGAVAEYERELLKRTPGVASFNPFDWPVVDGIPLAFIGYGEDERLLKIVDVQSAIRAAFSEIDADYNGSLTPYVLVFRELTGERYTAVIDLD